MPEVARRMSKASARPVSTRDARRYLRQLEHTKGVKLIFKNKTAYGRAWLWTTEALIRLHLSEFIDRPQRALSEVRSYQARVREMIQEVEQEAEAREADLLLRISSLEKRMRALESKSPR